MVIIIGILAAIAIPTFLAQREKAVIATCKSDARNAAEAAVLWAAQNDAGGNDFSDANGQPPDLAALNDQGFNASTNYQTDTALDGNGDLTITTQCPTPPGGQATWSSAGSGGFAANEVRGEVVYTP